MGRAAGWSRGSSHLETIPSARYIICCALYMSPRVPLLQHGAPRPLGALRHSRAHEESAVCHGSGAKRRVGWMRERRSARTGHRSRVAATPTARLPRCDMSTVSSCRPAALSCFRHIPNPCAQPDLLGPQSHVARHLPFHPHTLTKDAKASLPPARRCPVFCVCVSTLACQCASSHSRFRIFDNAPLPRSERATTRAPHAPRTHARTPEDALRSKRNYYGKSI